MGTRYLIDTNVLIDAQAGKISNNGLQILSEIIDKEFLVSFVTYIEFLGYPKISDSSIQFVNMSTVIEIDKDIINKCIEIRKKYSIKLPDTIIASTAISRNLILISRNIKDFEKIEELSALNIYDL